MERARGGIDPHQAYHNAVRQTYQSLAQVDDVTLIGLTHMGIAEVQALKQEVAEILPAGNLPAFLLQGLVQLKSRTLPADRVAGDLRLIFQATKQVGLFGTFLAAPALALRGYQKLLILAGKDVDSAFPDGPWQFYTTFGLREDAARHCAETTGFQQTAPGANDAAAATAWVCAAIQAIAGYDDLLANEWDERMLPHTLAVLLREHAAAEIPAGTPKDDEHLAAHVAVLAGQYGVEQFAGEWAKQRPYAVPATTPLADYAAYRRAQFRAYVDQALRQLPPDFRAALDRRFLARRKAELPAYQHQMALLMTLDPASYCDQRTPVPFQQAHIALVIGGRYYLLDVCARDANGGLLVVPFGGQNHAGSVLHLHQQPDGTLCDAADRPVVIDRRGQVAIDGIVFGRLKTRAPADVHQQVAAIIRHAQNQPAADPATAVDVVLAQAPRERQTALRGLLDTSTQDNLHALRTAPIIINWDAGDGAAPLTTIRQTNRGIGDHAATILRTDRSVVFDLSHVVFDGGWGMAFAEMLTNLATSTFAALTPPAPAAAQPPLGFRASPAFFQAAHDAVARNPAEAAAETTAIDLLPINKLRRRLARRQLVLTVNDLLILGRCMHATGYRPGPIAQHALGMVATLPDGPHLAHQIRAYWDEQRLINPALLIPMDASAVEPRLRLYPATFRNPLPELLPRLDRCNRLVSQLAHGADAAALAVFEQERTALFGDLYTFGATLQALKQVTMQGESFSTAALRLLGHMPQPMQYLLDLIPQKIGILNEIIKGREVFSNVGQVATSATLTRFASARDDGDTKELIWGIMSDARGNLIVTLRDFRPHVAPLRQCGRADLADALAQDYLDDYAAGVNALVRRIQRVLAYTAG